MPRFCGAMISFRVSPSWSSPSRLSVCFRTRILKKPDRESPATDIWPLAIVFLRIASSVGLWLAVLKAPPLARLVMFGSRSPSLSRMSIHL